VPVRAQSRSDSTGALALVSAVVRKTTGRPLDEFARATLFEPLAISGAEWSLVRGDTDAGGGLRLRPRDMAKIGQLVLAKGRWNDRQIVSKGWIDASTAPLIKATDNQSYGYLWRLGRSLIQGRQVHWVGALGRGGQSIRIVPKLDLIVVVTAGDYSPKAFQAQYDVFRDVCGRFHRPAELGPDVSQSSPALLRSWPKTPKPPSPPSTKA
jgi:CubicO group peptidase (beta-lactamase class C family)